jgi:GDPmannose 4,6-dehydratase
MTPKQRTALILGVSGQDGSLLAQKLVKEGWRVRGTFRRGEATKLWRLQEMDLVGKIELINLNLHEPFQVVEAISSAKPDHIYHFAGESFVADSYHQPRLVLETNLLGTLNVLESIRLIAPEAKLFFASSSEVFGTPSTAELLDENSPFRPINPYAISKLSAQQMVATYRDRHKLHAITGMMFNHESPMRARNFVTRKITYHLARLKLEGGPPMQLGAMDSCRDWGSASDYIEAMTAAVDFAPPQDYVFATGRKTSVRDFLKVSAEAAGFSPAFEGEGANMTCRDIKSGQALAAVSPQYFRPFDTPPLIGDPSRLKKATGFAGSRDVAAIAEDMVKTDLHRRKNGSTHV